MNVAFGHNGPVTVAVLVPEPGSIADRAVGDESFVGIAVCSPKDLYVRGIGEKIALGRAMIALGEELEAQGDEQSATLIEAFTAKAAELGRSISVSAVLSPAEFEKVAQALDELEAIVTVDFA